MNEVRVLLVESNPEDALFLREALAEIQETLPQEAWMTCRTMHVDQLGDACSVAAYGECDVVLLDPALKGISPLAAFTELREAAPDMPVVLLTGRDDEVFARRMLREGAQDFLAKHEIDCAPLARAIRNAIERQRFVASSRRESAFDELTGLYNARGFHAAAVRELQLAAAAGLPLLVVVAEIDNLAEIVAAYGAERRVLTMLDAAEVLRNGAGDPALLACLTGNRFAVLVWNMRADELIARVQHYLADHPRPFAFAFGWQETQAGKLEPLDVLLNAAEASLCENKQSYQQVPAPSPLTPRTARAAAYPA